MTKIKSFIYLDEYKLYSYSSQILEGVTEHLIDYRETSKEEGERQSGPFGSGREMANLLRSETITQERKFLHDYSYTIFENRLEEEGRVVKILESESFECDKLVGNAAFVQVRAKAAFNDMNIIKSNIEGFNELGEALAYVTNFQELEEQRAILQGLLDKQKDRNSRNRVQQQLRALNNVGNLARSSGLRQDPEFLKKLGYLLDYGFQDQFEVQMNLGEFRFTSSLKREYLRETEQMLVRKYSRFSQVPFVLFGTIAQHPVGTEEDQSTEETELPDSPVDVHMKEVIMQLVESLSAVEATFSGRLENEIVIDPIALYCEL